jgi:hypothetical protein
MCIYTYICVCINYVLRTYLSQDCFIVDFSCFFLNVRLWWMNSRLYWPKSQGTVDKCRLQLSRYLPNFLESTFTYLTRNVFFFVIVQCSLISPLYVFLQLKFLETLKVCDVSFQSYHNFHLLDNNIINRYTWTRIPSGTLRDSNEPQFITAVFLVLQGQWVRLLSCKYRL